MRIRRSTLRSCFLAALLAATLVAGGGCRARETAVAETSGDTFTSPSQRGTPDLWARVLEGASSDGKPRVHIINQGEDALLLRVNLIRSAKRSIRIQTYMWGNDECGRFIVWELIRAVKQRGVHVQIIADQMFSDVETPLLAWLTTVDPKFEVKFFNPNADRLNPSFFQTLGEAASDFKALNLRMHDKTFIVDDDIVITGGRNYFKEYYDRNIGLIYKDRDVLVAGPGASKIVRSFEAFWQTPRAVHGRELVDVKEALDKGKLPSYSSRSEFAFYHLFDALERCADDPACIEQRIISRLIPAERVDWVYDTPIKNNDPTLGGDSISSKRLRALVASAKEEVLIQSPYFILSDLAVAEVKQMRADRPDLRFIVSTNSLAATDAWYVYGVTFKQKRMFLQELGIRMYELKPIPQDMHLMANVAPLLSRAPTPAEWEGVESPPFVIDKRIAPAVTTDDQGREVRITDRRNPHTGTPPFMSLHGKSCVIDGRIAYIGSYNVHPRSQNLDTEVGVIIDDPRVAQLLKADIERDIAPRNSYAVAAAERPREPGPVSSFLNRVSENFALDLWPAHYSTSFELREGGNPVPPGHPDFYNNWQDAGQFPLLKPFNSRGIKTRISKTLGWFIKPIM